MNTELPIIRLDLVAYADRVDLRSRVDTDADWNVVRDAIRRARDELNLQLRNGPSECPFHADKPAA